MPVEKPITPQEKPEELKSEMIETLKELITSLRAKKMSLPSLFFMVSKSGELEILEKKLQENGITPEEIGTSREELDKINKELQLDSARRYLNEARHYFPEPHYGGVNYVKRLKEALNRVKASPEEIGTSIEELEKLQKLEDEINKLTQEYKENLNKKQS